MLFAEATVSLRAEQLRLLDEIAGMYASLREGGGAFRMEVISFALRSLIFNRLKFLHFSYLDRSTSGRLLSKYVFDTQKVQDLVLTILNQFLPTLFYGVSVMLILLVVDWRLSLVVLLVVPIVVSSRLIFLKNGSATKTRTCEWRRKSSRATPTK